VIAQISPLAGKTIEPSMLVNVPRLVTALSQNETACWICRNVAGNISRSRGAGSFHLAKRDGYHAGGCHGRAYRCSRPDL
jgi:hypothetical protein